MSAILIPGIADYEHARDPLKAYRCCGNHIEWVYRNLHRAVVYVPGANKSGKSVAGGAFGVALCRGVRELAAFDGTPIAIPCPPYSRIDPIRVGIGTPSYKLGEGSIMAAIYALIGDWPHHIRKTSAGTDVIHIRHERDSSEDWNTWSEMYVFPYEGPEPEAVRLDAFIADEPPPSAWLDAIFNRGKRGRRLYGMIPATPIDEREWGPVRKLFPEAEREVVSGRAKIHASVYDNRFLHVPGCPGHDAGAGYCSCSCPDIVSAEEANEGSPYAGARLRGEHVNAVGGNPYPPHLIANRESLCREPIERFRFVVQGKREGFGGLETVEIACTLEMWAEDDPNDEYILLADTGRGMNDGIHDPDGIHVRSRLTRALVARVSEYVGPWGLAAACAEVGRAYRNADVYPLRGGGYGDTVLAALDSLGYPYIGRDLNVAKARQTGGMMGVNETGNTRIMAMNAVGALLQRGTSDIPSADVWRCVRRCRINPAGKLEARSGEHDEDLILLGHGERILDMLGPMAERVVRESPLRTRFRDAVRIELGVDPDAPPSAGRGTGLPSDLGNWG